MFRTTSISPKLVRLSGKRIDVFLWHFQDRWDKILGTIWKICEIDFSIDGYVFLSNITKKWVNGFSWNFHGMLGNTHEIVRSTVSRLTRPFHCLPLRFNRLFDFHEISTLGRIWHRRQSGSFLGCCVQPNWYSVYIFFFLDPCLLALSRNKGWIDIHEIFRRCDHTEQLARQ